MDNLVPVSTQRGLPVRPPASSRNATLAALWRTYDAQPVQLQRTREGRNLSRERYRRAEEFMPSLAPEAPGDWPDFLYSTGIVAQLALSSHLLDVGFPDTWCARYVGLHIDRSLAYANASGFGYECAETARLAAVSGVASCCGALASSGWHFWFLSSRVILIWRDRSVETPLHCSRSLPPSRASRFAPLFDARSSGFRITPTP